MKPRLSNARGERGWARKGMRGGGDGDLILAWELGLGLCRRQSEQATLPAFCALLARRVRPAFLVWKLKLGDPFLRA
jgi:hypothetical protein